MNVGEGPRTLPAGVYRNISISEVRLIRDNAQPGTIGWLCRFGAITFGESAEKWPSVNGINVQGLLDADGRWIADFPEPTVDDPTIL